MDVAQRLGNLGGVLGDRARSRMLAALLDGRAHTATELAWEADIGSSTASAHLKKLLDAGLLSLQRQGRHRYFRLRDGEVAEALEALLRIDQPLRPGKPTGPRDPAMRLARTCYDHLAGQVAVALAQRLVARGLLEERDTEFRVTADGDGWFDAMGVMTAELAAGRRKLAPRCVDWSERQSHIAGALGAGLLSALETRGVVRRQPDSRAVQITAKGARWLDRELALRL